jgi:organic radical activating enzyme
MACPHCCFACRPGIGKDMSKETFLAAVQLAVDHGDIISLGGGEPTLHPQFWEFLTIAMVMGVDGHDHPVWLATNGADTEIALKLAKMTKRGMIEAVLSQDQWHDPIDDCVVEAFQKLKRSSSVDNEIYHEGIRSNRKITPHGSALKNKLYTSETACCCEDPLINPAGMLFGCGCRKVKFGTVFDPKFPDDFEVGTCAVEWKKLCASKTN